MHCKTGAAVHRLRGLVPELGLRLARYRTVLEVRRLQELGLARCTTVMVARRMLGLAHCTTRVAARRRRVLGLAHCTTGVVARRLRVLGPGLARCTIGVAARRLWGPQLATLVDRRWQRDWVLVVGEAEAGAQTLAQGWERHIPPWRR